MTGKSKSKGSGQQESGFAIRDFDGSWVAGSIEPIDGDGAGPFPYPLIMGLRRERKLYPTREAAQEELDRTCSLGTYKIVGV